MSDANSKPIVSGTFQSPPVKQFRAKVRFDKIGESEYVSYVNVEIAGGPIAKDAASEDPTNYKIIPINPPAPNGSREGHVEITPEHVEVLTGGLALFAPLDRGGEYLLRIRPGALHYTDGSLVMGETIQIEPSNDSRADDLSPKGEPQPRALTFGEYRVGINFNPGGNNSVNNIKRMAADLIDYIEAIPAAGQSEAQAREVGRCKALAQTHIEDAAMWAVKAATKPRM